MGNRLLLADDSITIQKVVAIIFANEEFELTVVDNGIAALEKAREIRPDVMLVDALMPGKSGYEVCEEIRRDPQLSATPILLLIGAFDHPDDERARDCGADASISKPFESQQLIDRVKELLALGQTRQVASPPSPLLVESAAEMLWGDLSSFDTMPPPAAADARAGEPAPAAARESAAFAAPAEPFSDFGEEPFAFPEGSAEEPFSFAELVEVEEPPPLGEPLSAEEPDPFAPFDPFAPAASAPTEAKVGGYAPYQPPPISPLGAAEPPATPHFKEEIVEASLEDDLWGAFELDDGARPAVTAPPTAAVELEPEAEFEAEEFFSFEDESELIEETGPALGADQVEEPVVHPAEEPAGFSGEEPFGPTTHLQPLILCEYEPLSFEPEPVEPAPPEIVEPAAAAETGESAAPDFVAAVCEGAEAKARASLPVISEEALAQAVSRVSREVIERIVWEVVPDLAERLIVEEIRKLKAGIRG